MIRHHVQKSAADAKRYYARGDYYTEGADLHSVFGGKGAERLGISGPADKEHFDRLCDNLHPLTGGQLTARMNDGRIVGIDLTFDGPKGASVIEALSTEEERRKLSEARLLSELETLAEMERAMAARVRKGGKDENRTTGNMLYYRVSHGETRPVDGVPDMQPHEHYFVLNATFDPAEGGRWKAANLYDILRDMPYYQAAYQQRHARRLQDLGYEVERKGNAFELAGVPGSVVSKFSRRTQLIEKAAAEQGIIDAARKAELGAKTREHKAKDMSPAQLRRLWASRLTGGEQQALAKLIWEAGKRRAEPFSRRQENGPAITPAQAMDHAARHVLERKSSAPATELVAHALTYGVGRFDVAEAWKHLESADRFTATVDGRLHVASRAVLAEEQGMVKLAREGRATLAPVAPAWEIQDRRLEIDQRAAVHHLLASRDFVTMVVGDAGTGKTTALTEARHAAEASGLRVLAFAPSARASRGNLQQEGFAGATTVAALMESKRLQQQARGQVLLVDEAAMLGTKETAALLKLARELGARVWLVGDDKQHRSVTRGEPFALLTREAGLVPARITKVRRQKPPKYKQLATLAKDRPALALDQMQALGWVREVPDAERYRLLAADYVQAVAPERRKVKRKWEEVTPTALVIAPSHAEGAKVTAAIRDGLRERGLLGEEREFLQLVPKQLTQPEREDPHSYQPGDVIQFTQNAKGHRRGERVEVTEGCPPPAHLAARFQAYRPGTLPLARGDRVRVTANGTTKDGHRLNNGDLFEVAGFTKSGDLLDSRGWIIPKDYGHLAHGYAVTSVASQSATVDRVLVAIGQDSIPAANRREWYVDLTRGREWARLYTHDAEALKRPLMKDDKQISATELAKLRQLQARRRRASQTADVRLHQRRAAVDRPLRTLDTTKERLPERELTYER